MDFKWLKHLSPTLAVLKPGGLKMFGIARYTWSNELIFSLKEIIRVDKKWKLFGRDFLKKISPLILPRPILKFS